MFFCVNDSVAAVKIEISWIALLAELDARSLLIASAPDVADGIALGSFEEVFNAGLSSGPGEGGGVGYASRPVDDCAFHSFRKLSNPFTFGRSHWYVIGVSD